MALKPFSKTQDEAKIRAASEVEPIQIPFKHPEFLSKEYSDGATEYCFFLKNKQTGEIFPWNSHMAESGNVHFHPHMDLEELNNPDHASVVSIWARQGILPKGYGPQVEPIKPKPAPIVGKAKIPVSA